MTSWIKQLSDPTPPALAEVGGKGAHLAALIAAGCTVPPGFCVTTAAYQHIVSQSALRGQIAARLAAADLSVLDNVRACGAFVRELIMAQELPAAMSAAILAAYYELQRETPFLFWAGQGYVAVRSSATTEDFPDLSFAGQHDTYLNVLGEADLVFAVKKCWASLWSDRAIAYRHTHHIDHLNVCMAVVIQQMVPATVSGILFTANPVTQRRDECLINAHWGLGEGIVSGTLSPDEFLIAKDTLTITRQTIVEKPMMVTLGEHGAVEVPVPAAHQRQPCLTETQIRELAEIGKQIESQFHAPQDIEWAFADTRLVILQARPITTLQAQPAAVPVIWGDRRAQELLQGKVVFWSNFNTGETMPSPLTPLSWSYFSKVISILYQRFFGLTPDSPLYPYYCNLVDLVYGRVYWNLTTIYGNPIFGPLFRRLLHTIDQAAGELFNAWYKRGELRPLKIPIRLKHLGVALFQTLRIGGGVLFTPRLFPMAVLNQRIQRYEEKVKIFKDADLSGQTDLELIDAIKTFSQYSVNSLAFTYLLQGYGMICYEVLRWLTSKWADVPADKLIAGIPGNKTTEGALELYELSEMPDSLKQRFLACPLNDIPAMLPEDEDGRQFLQRLERYMVQFGHRGPKAFDIGQPRAYEDPSFVFQMIKNYLQLGAQDTTPPEHFHQMAAERERVTACARQHLSKGLGDRIFPVKRWLFETMLNHAQTYLPWRENPKYYALKWYAGARQRCLELGRRWNQRGLLESPDEIFFLTLPELEIFGAQSEPERVAIQRLVQQRKAEWQANRNVAPPPIVRSDGKPVTLLRPEAHTADVLRGTAAASGKARGKARIIHDPAEGCAFDNGEILVAPFTDPGWTPLFLTAKAVVMEVGGVMCHGAVVAREYGLPAVVGVKHATELIHTGDEIIVDGDQGLVILVNHAR